MISSLNNYRMFICYKLCRGYNLLIASTMLGEAYVIFLLNDARNVLIESEKLKLFLCIIHNDNHRSSK